jgi:hypothetical protein
MMMNEAIERVAEAIWNASWDTRPSGGSVLFWAELRPEVQARYRAMAWAATNEFIEILRADEILAGLGDVVAEKGGY